MRMRVICQGGRPRCFAAPSVSSPRLSTRAPQLSTRQTSDGSQHNWRISERSCCSVGGNASRGLLICSFEIVPASRRVNRCRGRSCAKRPRQSQIPALPACPGSLFETRPTALLSKGPLQGQGQGRAGMHNLRCGFAMAEPAGPAHNMTIRRHIKVAPVESDEPCPWRPFRDKCSCHGA